MTQFRWRCGDRKGIWQPTRREALAAGRYALSKRREANGDSADGAELIEVEERHRGALSQPTGASDD